MPAAMHLIDTAGPGGAETIFAQLASRVGAGKVQPLTIVPREDWLSNQLRTLGLQPLILPAHGSLQVSYAAKLIGLIRRHRVRLIHAHLLGSSVYAALVGLLTNTPVIAIFHGPSDVKSPGRLAGIKRWLLKHGSSACVAVSTSTYDALVEFGLARESLTLIQNGVDTDTFEPGIATDLREELGITRNDLLVGAVGNIRKPKSYEILLRAAARVCAQLPNVHFVVCGQGDADAMRPLLALQQELGLAERFRFLGFRKNTCDLYRNFDVFVSSSKSEGLSLSFLEAMATGRAVVSTRSGGPQEVINDGEAGLLVPIEDPPALADALMRALSSKELREQLGSAARARVVRDFSLSATIEKYEAIYAKLLGGQPAFLDPDHGTL